MFGEKRTKISSLDELPRKEYLDIKKKLDDVTFLWERYSILRDSLEEMGYRMPPRRMRNILHKLYASA